MFYFFDKDDTENERETVGLETRFEIRNLDSRIWRHLVALQDNVSRSSILGTPLLHQLLALIGLGE